MESSSEEENISPKQTPTKKLKTQDCQKKRKKNHTPAIYNKKLEEQYPFLKPHPSDVCKAMCKLCPASNSGSVSFFRCERSDIERHVKTERHITSFKSVTVGNADKLKTYLNQKKGTPLDKQIKYAEIKLSGFVVAHNEPFLKMDHLVEVLKDIFPDSKIAQMITSKRTKTKAIVMNVLGLDEKEHLVSVLKNCKFSILVDESTDISSVKTFCIVVRYYCKDSGRITSRFWDLQQVFSEDDPEGAEEGATARKLFAIMKSLFDKYNIPFENVIGFGSDGCNTMMGCDNSVASRMIKLCPGLRICKCICHSLHICASEACKCLPRSSEDLARYIHSFFKASAKRRAQFAEFQTFVELDVLRMLHPSQTRWLSLIEVINRVIKYWDALRLFFDAKWIGERLESAERIHILLNDAAIKTFYIFLQWVLPKITCMNEYFQSEKSVVTVVHDRMVNCYQDLLSCFMLRSYICTTPIKEICPDNESKWLPLEQLYLGVGVYNQLLLPDLQRKKEVVLDFKIRCRMFLVTLCCELRKRYDFADPMLKSLRIFAPEAALSQKETENTPSLYTLTLLMPRIISPNNTEIMQKIDNQWRILPFQIENFPKEIKDTKDPEEFWHKIHLFEDKFGDRPFATLGRFALDILSIPIANADCERIFSKINDIKTKKGNKLITSTMCGILHADAVVRDSGKCCVAFEPRKSMYDKMTNTNIYQSHFKENEDPNYDVENVFAGYEDY